MCGRACVPTSDEVCANTFSRVATVMILALKHCGSKLFSNKCEILDFGASKHFFLSLIHRISSPSVVLENAVKLQNFKGPLTLDPTLNRHWDEEVMTEFPFFFW